MYSRAYKKFYSKKGGLARNGTPVRCSLRAHIKLEKKKHHCAVASDTFVELAAMSDGAAGARRLFENGMI